MRKLILIAALLIVEPALAVDSNSFRVGNAADLIELCSVPAADPLHANAMGFCHGYLTGSYHFYDSTEPASNRLICSPTPTPKRADVMSAFVAWGRRHPEHMKERAVDALFRFLAETYPCKNPR